MVAIRKAAHSPPLATPLSPQAQGSRSLPPEDSRTLSTRLPSGIAHWSRLKCTPRKACGGLDSARKIMPEGGSPAPFILRRGDVQKAKKKGKNRRQNRRQRTRTRTPLHPLAQSGRPPKTGGALTIEPQEPDCANSRAPGKEEPNATQMHLSPIHRYHRPTLR